MAKSPRIQEGQGSRKHSARDGDKLTLMALMKLTLPLWGFSVPINYKGNYNFKIIKITMIKIWIK